MRTAASVRLRRCARQCALTAFKGALFCSIRLGAANLVLAQARFKAIDALISIKPITHQAHEYRSDMMVGSSGGLDG
jgi:hypothetical protein